MTGIIILAAGNSSRLGQPKQNLVYKGKTLLQRAVETAMASVCERIVVVLGANLDTIKPGIESYNAEMIENTEWQEGMASSIRAGIGRMLALEPKVQSVILMLCDQPHVDTYILNILIAAKTKEGICACEFNETVGPPVLFDAVYFDELLTLTGNEGAKKIMLKYAEKVKEIPFAQGRIDIDTIADYERLAG